MLNDLRKLLRKPEVTWEPVAPETPFAVIGDIHGRADLLATLLKKLVDYPIVCVGDYIDRGNNSADVIACLQARPDITCLSGNHEEMMLRFIDDPVGNARWLLHGGLQTLASYGLRTPSPSAREPQLVETRSALCEALGADSLTWVRNLPMFWSSGNIAVVHAGADPSKPIESQKEHSLMWGHPQFFKQQRTDGIWVVHGHTVVEQPSISEGRISIDTAAYATDRLTAVIVEQGHVRFEIT